MRIALYQPDIAANTGTIIRLGACMNVAVDIIEPCGFPFGDAALKRAGLDFGHQGVAGHWLDRLRRGVPKFFVERLRALDKGMIESFCDTSLGTIDGRTADV